MATEHEDFIHDTQIDYYGQYLASCSSDRTVKVWQIVDDNTQNLVATLRGHEGPVWQVAWAHPKYSHSSILASCSYDHKVIIWKEVDKHSFQAIKTYTGHTSSVNSIAWAPHEFGLMLASTSSDGSVTVLTYNPTGEEPWAEQKFQAHQIGCNAVSWAPCTSPDGKCAKRLATGGCDNAVKTWIYDEETQEWKEEKKFTDHQDWVRDVAWSPNVGVPNRILATCSQDRTVKMYEQTEDGWNLLPQVPKFEEAVWRLSWNVSGTILAITTGDNKVTLLKEHGKEDGAWKSISVMDTANDAA
jgi:protein transport protein SEC13